MEEDESDQYEVAGQMRSVIPSTNILVVQTINSPAILEELLDNGTPMFERCVRYTYGSVVTGGPREQWYRQIGIIDDLFGSVSEPMYALRLEPGIKPDSLLMGSNVFFMPRNAETKFIRLRMESSGSYSVEYEKDE
ncbi:hypothetical protein QAD02_004855 [Eretmocerus hayati]|uniref:Uncharacterized protein n=1 Tax=Eretmocerus hayati TaxID=131215 RepID=A0ACC2NRX4_9HYME|nr:hypothetical protein QAD02_004855 [Eretmocerus hayati]